ncbi:MAG TPA: DUF4157 domain-containing protein, partial [Allosphingosinicella sp.]
LQAKLKVAAVDDPLEREADRVADRLVGASAAPAAVSRAGAGDVRRAEAGAGAAAGPGAEAALGGLGAGVPLGADERSFFEPRLGRDLSAIRIHTGGAADKASKAIAARAFTRGTDIAFADGEYQPGTPGGRHLLAHELAHTLQAGGGGAIRRKCAADPPDCAEDKLKLAQAKVAGNTTYARFIYKAATSKCYRPTDIADSIRQVEPGLFSGSLAKYVETIVQPLNKTDPERIHAGDCFAFPFGWKDPNIGDVDAELAKLKTSAGAAEKNHIIATLYAEQSAAGMDEQRKYIFYAMLLRIQHHNWGPNFQSVVTTGTFHATDPQTDTYKNNYVPAKQYLEGAKPTKPVNTAVIDNLKAIVDGASAAGIPANAGPYYFHWSSETTTAESAYQAHLKAKVAPDVAEKKAAYKQAKDRLGASLEGITEAQGWLHKVPGPDPASRFGAMYIYR